MTAGFPAAIIIFFYRFLSINRRFNYFSTMSIYLLLNVIYERHKLQVFASVIRYGVSAAFLDNAAIAFMHELNTAVAVCECALTCKDVVWLGLTLVDMPAYRCARWENKSRIQSAVIGEFLFADYVVAHHVAYSALNFMPFLCDFFSYHAETLPFCLTISYL